MDRRTKLLIIAPVAIAAMIGFAFLGGQIVRLLWNAVLPPLFNFPQVTFWQALGLLALCRILFGGMGLGGRRSGMSAEMRERIRQRMRSHPRYGDPSAGATTSHSPMGSALSE
jgi:hypothetical protein